MSPPLAACGGALRWPCHNLLHVWQQGQLFPGGRREGSAAGGSAGSHCVSHLPCLQQKVHTAFPAEHPVLKPMALCKPHNSVIPQERSRRAAEVTRSRLCQGSQRQRLHCLGHRRQRLQGDGLLLPLVGLQGRHHWHVSVSPPVPGCSAVAVLKSNKTAINCAAGLVKSMPSGRCAGPRPGFLRRLTLLCYGQTRNPPLRLQVCLDRRFSVCYDALRERLIGSVDACRRTGFTGGFEGDGAARWKGCALDLQKPAPCNKGRLGPGFMAASSGPFTGPSQLSSGLHSRGDQLTNRHLQSWGCHCGTKEASTSSQVSLCALEVFGAAYGKNRHTHKVVQPGRQTSDRNVFLSASPRLTLGLCGADTAQHCYVVLPRLAAQLCYVLLPRLAGLLCTDVGGQQ